MLKLFEREQLNLAKLPEAQTAIEVRDLCLRFGDKHVLHNITMRIPKNRITALIGQSGCGKSTLISCFNRMNDLIDNSVTEGEIIIDGRNINRKKENLSILRSQVGMVFQRPNPFPMSIYDNVCYGLRLQGIKQRRQLDDAVERALIEAALWDEVKDRLFESATTLSGGQQQRLVIARALALKPSILLLDEPTSALDPLTTLIIEELMADLKKRCTIVIVTHNMQQASRVSDYTAFLHQGELVEYSDSDTLFTLPEKKQTEDYITGRYGGSGAVQELMMRQVALNTHISGRFNIELENLRNSVMAMGGEVEQQLADTLKAIATNNPGLAETVILNDLKINSMEIQIDEECLRIIAKRHPTASDLRLIMIISKAITDIERMGDEIERIARLVTKQKLPTDVAIKSSMLSIGQQAVAMMRGTFDAFARLDEEAALEVYDQDNSIDSEYKKLLSYTADEMSRSGDSMEDWLEILWALRSLERIGDRCKNICEYVVSLTSGRDVRHTPLENLQQKLDNISES